MRPLLLSTYDRIGGAARATYRLHRGLRGIGVDSKLLVQRRVTDDSTVHAPEHVLARKAARVRPFLDSLPLLRYSCGRRAPFSPAILPDGLVRRIEAERGDVVHIHWIAGGFLRPETLARIDLPIVWTLHDSWAFTGGCHVPHACTRYREACGACPVLGSRQEEDLSRRLWRRKRSAWRETRLTVVSPSRWLAEAARSSSLLGEARLEVIPNGIDLARFRPTDRREARERLGIDPATRVILFGGVGSTTDPNKGFPLLRDALARAATSLGAPESILLILGEAPPDPLPGLAIRARFTGAIAEEERISLVHAAADVLVLPSRQENQPNMVLEAMACGRPAVAFRTSGLPDLVEHRKSGYLAEPFDEEDLARGMVWVLENEGRREELGAEARRRAERRHDLERVARSYADLYDSLASVRGEGSDVSRAVP